MERNESCFIAASTYLAADLREFISGIVRTSSIAQCIFGEPLHCPTVLEVYTAECLRHQESLSIASKRHSNANLTKFIMFSNLISCIFLNISNLSISDRSVSVSFSMNFADSSLSSLSAIAGFGVPLTNTTVFLKLSNKAV